MSVYNLFEKCYIKNMSATTELLIEQIRQVETELEVARASNADITLIEESLCLLRKKLTTSLQALNENKLILKG